jgi:hypothetical protein
LQSVDLTQFLLPLATEPLDGGFRRSLWSNFERHLPAEKQSQVLHKPFGGGHRLKIENCASNTLYTMHKTFANDNDSFKLGAK